jgi:hypothetical protein
MTVRKVDCSSNSLTGTLPLSFANWSAVEEVSFSDNSLTGGLPREYEDWQSIRYAYFGSNCLLPSIPVSYDKVWADTLLMDLEDVLGNQSAAVLC